MKRPFFLSLLLAITVTVSFAQTTSKSSNESLKEQRIDSLLTRIDTLVQMNNAWLEQIELDHSLKNRYKLYSTENIYTFLQLDTKTGQIEQVQWSLDSKDEGSVTINEEDLTYGYGYGSNCFELYPTKNMYQFILLNKTNGRKWHVQWGMKSSERWIRRIY